MDDFVIENGWQENRDFLMEVLTYGIFARVNLFSQNERASEFCENKLTSARIQYKNASHY
jgi:hypothetical protein